MTEPVWTTVTREGDDSAARLQVDLNSARVDLGDGLWMYESNRVVIRNWSRFEVDLYLEMSDGRLAASQIDVRRGANGEALSSELLREIPVASLVRYGREAILRVDAEQDREIAERLRSGRASGKPTVVMRAMSEMVAWPTPEDAEYVTLHGLDDQTLRIVARIYRVAYMVGIGPTKAVEEALSLPRSTAGRWVAQARKRGLLGETTPGKAGA